MNDQTSADSGGDGIKLEWVVDRIKTKQSLPCEAHLRPGADICENFTRAGVFYHALGMPVCVMYLCSDCIEQFQKDPFINSDAMRSKMQRYMNRVDSVASELAAGDQAAALDVMREAVTGVTHGARTSDPREGGQNDDN